MVFLPGDHVLDASVTVANVARFTMRGKSFSSDVVCDLSVGFSFTGMVNFKIHSITFNSCSRKNALPPGGNYALLLQSTQYTELVNCSFHNNPGTALVVINANVTLAGNTEFTHNHCTESNSCIGGGGIQAVSSNLTFTGNTTFLHNVAANSNGGGAINAPDNSVLTFHGNSNFINNSAESGRGGAIYASKLTVLSFNGTSNFTNNSAHTNRGGAIYTSYNTVISFNGISNFVSNSAYNNRGGGIYTSDNTVLSFNGLTKFTNNSAVHGGAIFSSENTALHFNGTSKFVSNSATVYGGAIRAGGNSKLIFNGTISFTNNGPVKGAQTGDVSYGGGINMGQKCTFSILPNTTVYWVNNHATFGGAIYVYDGSPLSYCTEIAPYIPKEHCFFQLPGQNLSIGTDVQLVFKGNSADVAGSVLYGGAIDNCKLNGLELNGSGEVFDMIFHIDDADYNTTSIISSDPLCVCPCEHNLQNCNTSQYYVPYAVYPGETFEVSVVVAGQRDGAVPGAVRSKITKTKNNANPGNLQGYQYLQQANKTCTKLNYTVFSQSQSVDIVLQAEDSPCFEFGLHISVNINQTCPPGFNISESARSCVCEPRLAKYVGTHQCIIKNGLGQITRHSSQHIWVGYDWQSDGLILHPHCPFDYCTSKTVNFSLNNTDVQCANDRSGLLCGDCKEEYSLVLGTSHCEKCTNIYLMLLIPFAVMGVALVFLLLVCKLTVATGTLSGLVFYANIIGANYTIFLPGESTEIFSVFIAWLNLDFGIETCFYNGMDAYSKTWLQFVFPVYLWVIVGIVILVSNFSHRFAKLLGHNPVSVLATLILLSYTKILRTLITVIYITYLEYPTYKRGVWLYDANIDYLSGKHIPLFLVALLVFIFLFLPYTLLLLFDQWLQAVSHRRLFSWVNSARLKPFMDSYHAPYKAKHRYWPGLLLVFRFILFLVFAFNFQEDPKTNLLAILIETGNLFLWLWISGGVYTNRYINVLEGSFVLNLIISSAINYCVNLLGGNQLIVSYVWTTSVSIAFATFIGILTFQLAKVTGIVRYLKKCAALRKCIIRDGEREMESDTDSLPDRLINPGEYEPVPQIAHEHTVAAEPKGSNGESNRLIPVYTYS